MGTPRDFIGFRVGRLWMNAVIDHATVYQMGIPDHAQDGHDSRVTKVEVVKVVKDQGVGVWARRRMQANDDTFPLPSSYKVEVSP